MVSRYPFNGVLKVFGKVRNTNIAALDVQSRQIGQLPSQNMFASRISQNIFEESKIGLIVTDGDQSGKKNTLTGGDFTYKTSHFNGSDNDTSSLK